MDNIAEKQDAFKSQLAKLELEIKKIYDHDYVKRDELEHYVETDVLNEEIRNLKMEYEVQKDRMSNFSKKIKFQAYNRMNSDATQKSYSRKRLGSIATLKAYRKRKTSVFLSNLSHNQGYNAENSY